MSDSPPPSRCNILLAVDLSTHGSAALEAAAQLAAQMRAELQGLFVEDLDLLRFAGLPFASEIDFSSGISRPLDIGTLEQALQRKAERVRRAIAETAQRTSLHWSFRTSRGRFVQTILSESVQADMLFIARERVSQIPSRPGGRRGPVMVVDDHSRSSQRLLDAADTLAQQHHDAIVLLEPGDHVEGGTTDVQSTCYVQRCGCHLQQVLEAVRHWKPQLLLIGRASPLVAESEVDALLSQLPCPLVLVQ